MERVERPLTDAELGANREALKAGLTPPFVQDLGRVASMGRGLRPGKTLIRDLKPRPTLTTGNRRLADPQRSLRG